MGGSVVIEILVVVGGTVGAIGVLGQVARARLRRRHGPTGRLVDIGGYRVHVDVRGPSGTVSGGVTGNPTVVLEGGTWAPGLFWAPVVERLAASFRVVTYDRAGLGWSDPSPRPRTAAVMAEELATMLERADVPAPYLLVGHSFGGTVVRLVAAAHPERVAGVVLLDAAHEAQFERYPEPVRAYAARMARMMPAVLGLLRLAVRLGLVALRPSLVPISSPGLPADVTAAIRAQVASRASVVATMTAELASLDAGNAAVRAHPPALGDLPLVVVRHGRPEGTPQFGPELAAEVERTWQELQAELAASSSRVVRTVATGIGHDIPTEAPDIVVEAVAAALELGRHEPASGKDALEDAIA